MREQILSIIEKEQPHFRKGAGGDSWRRGN